MGHGEQASQPSHTDAAVFVSLRSASGDPEATDPEQAQQLLLLLLHVPLTIMKWLALLVLLVSAVGRSYAFVSTPV